MSRNVLVLGGTRYFGKYLLQQLLNRGDQVTVMTRGKQPIPSACKFICFDRSGELPLTIEPDVYDLVFDQSAYTIDQMQSVLPLIIHSKRYIFSSSQAVYPAGLDLIEDDVIEPDEALSPYGSQKWRCEQYIKQHAASYIIARFPVVVGESDPYQRLQQVIQMVVDDRVSLPKTNPAFNFIEANDAASSLIHLADSNDTHTVNVACRQSITAQELCQKVALMLQRKINIEWKDSFHYEPFDLVKILDKTLNLQLLEQYSLNLASVDEVLQKLLQLYQNKFSVSC
ncbi:MAG: NAD-dependent epimerase/dehydratase family protein [Coxiellaceae bacterium]|nr:NAD-dependent epimerase/dehydratase family protein [Coxiellaceae bacterium]